MTLNEQFATPQAYVEHLNNRTPDNPFKLVYGEHMGATAQDVADYLDMETFSDWYKEVNGFRPRGFTLEQARAWMERESEEAQEVEDRESMHSDLRGVPGDFDPETDQDWTLFAETGPVNSTMADALRAALDSDEPIFARFNRAIAQDLGKRLPKG